MTTHPVLMPNSLRAWNTPDFRSVFKREAEQIEAASLPLQQALVRSSYVAELPFAVLLLSADETPDTLRIKAGISYAGIIAGCSCADDPTPVDTLTEYCEVRFDIAKASGETTVSLL